MIQQQRFGGTLLGTPAQFVKEYGAVSLTRGFTMTIGRCAAAAAAARVHAVPPTAHPFREQ